MVVCKKSTPLQFIPNLKYLFKAFVTVTYSQRQEYPHFVGASLSLSRLSSVEADVSAIVPYTSQIKFVTSY